MAYAYPPQPNEMKAPPPPYPPNDTMNFGMSYQHQTSPTGQSPYYNTPPPIPVYSLPPVVIQPLGGFLGRYPQATQCPSCRQQVVTNVRYEVGGATWLIALIICLFGGFMGCCFIPFCVPACQDAVHTCPSCHIQIARRSAF